MKISVNKLKNFIGKVTLNGEIKTSLLEFIPEGMKVSLKDTMEAVGVLGLLKGATSDLGKLPIKDTKKFLDVLKLFSKEVQLTKVENRLHIVDENISAELVLASEEFIENHMDTLPTVPYQSGGIKIESEIFVNALKSASILDATGMSIIIKDKELAVSYGEEGFDKIKHKQKIDYPDVALEMGERIQSVIPQLGKSISMRLGKGLPIEFKEVTEEFDITWVVCPVEKGEEGESKKTEEKKE